MSYRDIAMLLAGAGGLLVFQWILHAGEHYLGDRNSYERRWSRMQRAQRRELARLQKKGTP